MDEYEFDYEQFKAAVEDYKVQQLEEWRQEALEQFRWEGSLCKSF